MAIIPHPKQRATNPVVPTNHPKPVMPQTLYRQVRCAGHTERQKVLLLDKCEWDHYKTLLVKDALLADAAKTLREKKEAVKIKSTELRKTWRNTTENARNKQLQARADRLAADQREKEERSLEMQKIRAEERQQYLAECRKIMYYREDDVRVLNSALILSETLREREEQKKLERKIKALEEAKEKEWVEKVFKDVDEYLKEEKDKATALRAERVKHKDLLVDQIENIAATKKREAEIERLLEIDDIKKGQQEVELGKKLEKEEVKRQQGIVQRDFEESTENARKAREARKKEEEDENKVMFVYADTIERIETRRKKTLSDAQKAKMERMERIAKQVGAVQESRDEAENAAIRKAIAEKDAKDEEVRLKKEAFSKQIRDERIQGYKDFLAAQEVRKAQERDRVKWDLLQGFKTEEVDKAFFAKIKKKHEDALMENRLMLEAAIEKKRQDEIAGRFDLEGFYKAKEDKTNAEFLKYADEVLQQSEEKGRMLYPMQKVLVDYKVHNGLEKKKKTRTLHVSRVPCGEARKVAVPQACDCRVGPQNVVV